MDGNCTLLPYYYISLIKKAQLADFSLIAPLSGYGLLISPKNKIVFDEFSVMAITNGRLTSMRKGPSGLKDSVTISTDVAAAASVPFSFTSRYVFCFTVADP